MPPQLLEQALGLTRRLLARLEQGELEGTDELEAARSRLLRQAFAADPPIDPARQIELLEAIQALDRKITGLAGQARAELVRQLRDLNRGRKAGRAYRDQP